MAALVTADDRFCFRSHVSSLVASAFTSSSKLTEGVVSLDEVIEVFSFAEGGDESFVNI